MKAWILDDELNRHESTIRRIYEQGYQDGLNAARRDIGEDFGRSAAKVKKPKRKLSAWQKFVKANAKKPRFKYKSGSKKGLVNMKKLSAAWKKKRK